VGYDRVCSDLLGIGHRRRKIHKQGMIELQHVMRRIEVRDGVVAKTRIEREGVLAASGRPYVARRCDELVLSVSEGPNTVSLPLPTVIALPPRPASFTTSPLPLPRVIVSWLPPLAFTESPAPSPRVIAS
jgi:hypothetical protein